MLTFRNRERAASAVGANSLGSLRDSSVALGVVLVNCLLLSGLLGKSDLFTMDRRVWRVQMAVVAGTVIVGLVLGIWKRSGQWGGHSGRRLPLQIRACLAGLLAAGILSSVAQEHWAENLAFFAVFAGMVQLLCIDNANWTRSMSKERCVDIVLVPLCIMSVGGLLLLLMGSRWASSRLITQFRFDGLYCDPIICGQMSGVTSLLLFWRILFTRAERRWYHWLLLAATLLCLVLTRTRTDIVGTPVGMCTCLILAGFGGAPGIARRRARVVLAALAMVVLISPLLLAHAGMDRGRAAAYLRMEDSLQDTVRNRAPYWQMGLGTIALSNVFGEGPLAKFGGQLSVARSTYSGDLNAHSAVLSVFQYYGWPGGILFIVFLLSAAHSLIRRKDPFAALGLSLLAFGCVQCISENWLLSFGTPLDAYSWFILGLALAREPFPRRGGK